MAPRIQILPDRVANQIAAGEVVERPASVVKELVENAIDAGARRVEVSLRNGGKTGIRVSDDGRGMSREDALLALDRHATSKIREADDLASVSSFGFRGEALPSIAAVSRFELETAPDASGAGTRVLVRTGRITSVDEIARRAGTTVTVRGLFQNTPARAKFLHAAGAETRACSQAMVLLALANLRVGMRLESNGRELLSLPAASSVRDRVGEIWGEEEVAEFLAVDRSDGPLRVAGLTQRPDAARRGGSRRYLFVNGRPFRDPSLNSAVDEAYRTTVAADVHPAFFLYISLPPAAVDVNVHPAKAEVRFRDRPEVEKALRDAVRERLADLASTPPVTDGGAGEDEGSPDGSGGPAAASGERPEVDRTSGASAVAATEAPARGTSEEAYAGAEDEASQLAFFMARERAAGVDPEGEEGDEEGEERDPATGISVERPTLWQLHRSYILAATRHGLLIIDQHAAHERVLFEEIMDRFEGGEGTSQRLLFPITLRLSPEEYSAAEELSGLLHRTGFEVDAFGDRTVIVHASPDPHPYFDAERCFREMIHELAHGSALVSSARNQHERIAKSLACKGAIKAGQALSQDEMAELFDRLFATELPGHDVHGRPTIVRLTLDELERRFGRA